MNKLSGGNNKFIPSEVWEKAFWVGIFMFVLAVFLIIAAMVGANTRVLSLICFSNESAWSLRTHSYGELG